MDVGTDVPRKDHEMRTGAVEGVVERFFAAIEAGDRATLDELYANDVEVWHSATGRTVDKATGLAILGGSWPRECA